VNAIAELLIEAGLLQFGRFETLHGWRPFTLNLEYLPSYPQVLAAITTETVALLPEVEYMLAMADAVPYGIAVGVALHKPVVYSRGSDAAPVADLVGAYDIGHSGALLTSVLDDGKALRRLAANARSVGVDARVAVAILDLGYAKVPDMEMHALVRLPDAVTRLADECLIPSGQVDAVRAWIAAQHVD
jgi:orotate phosphoribosyltransferase